MELHDLDSDAQAVLEQALGYLNFSNGSFDPRFHRALNESYRWCRGGREAKPVPQKSPPPVWRQAVQLLRQKLSQLQETSDTFKNAQQADAALQIIEQHVIPAYREFHRDLLYHQPDDALFGPFMLGRMWETLLEHDQPWSEPDEVARQTVVRLSDYLGHRPVPAP